MTNQSNTFGDSGEPERPVGGKASAAESEAGSQKARRMLGRYVPGVFGWLVIASCTTGVLLVSFFGVEWDQAIVNLATAALAFVALIAVSIWFLAFSHYPPVVRLLVGVASVLSIVVWNVLFRIDHVRGDLTPHWQFRWAKSADELLDEASPSERIDVDLATTGPDDFPQFLGPGRDQRVAGVRLARDWSTNRPKRLWRQSIGAGWSSFVAANGFAVTMEQRGAEELVTCYEIETGKLAWSYAVSARHETVLGGIGPRATPAIDGGRVYSLGATGALSCLNGADGKRIWQRQLLDEIGTTQADDEKSVAWGRAGSPLIVDDVVIVPLGGPSGPERRSIGAFDKLTGEPRWSGGDREASYSSPHLATLAGRRQVLLLSEDQLAAFDPAAKEAHRKPLWTFDWPGGSHSDANTSQPMPAGADRVLVSKGYGAGAVLLNIVADANGQLSVDEIWREPARLRTKYTNVVIHEGHIYGLSDGILECVSLETGEKVWKTPRGRYGNGQILLAGDLLLVQSEDGELALVAASPDEFQEFGRIQALFGKSWNNLCLFGPRLLIRNGTEAACYELPTTE